MRVLHVAGRGPLGAIGGRDGRGDAHGAIECTVGSAVEVGCILGIFGSPIARRLDMIVCLCCVWCCMGGSWVREVSRGRGRRQSGVGGEL